MAIKVLFVDSHQILVEALITLFSSQADFSVVGWISDGEKALEKVGQTQPNLVILDMVTSKTDGAWITREIKKQFSQTAVLVLSAFADEANIMRMLQSGASGYLLKTATKETILQAGRVVALGGYYFDSFVSGKLVSILNNLKQKDQDLNGRWLLTGREVEILNEAAGGLSNRTIANSLGLSERTVKNHMSNIFTKLGCSSRTEAVTISIRLGYINLVDKHSMVVLS